MNARYYVPEVGRFASPDTLIPDPSNPQSYNRYSYVGNNPLNYTDPSGHCQGEYNLDTGQATTDKGCWDFLYDEFCSGGSVGICSNWTERLQYFPSCFSASCSINFGGGHWTRDELLTLRNALASAITVLNGAGHDGNAILAGVGYRRIHSGSDSFTFPSGSVNLRGVDEQTIWHETAHAVSFRNGHVPQNEYRKFAGGFASTPYYELSHFCYRGYCTTEYPAVYKPYTGVGPEYWADGFAAWVYTESYGQFPNPSNPAWRDDRPGPSATNWYAINRGASWSLKVAFGD